MTLTLAGPVHADSRIPVLTPVAAEAATGAVPAALQAASLQNASLQAGAIQNAAIAPAAPAEAPSLELQLAPIKGGMASYYGRHLAGARTASGAHFDPDGYTCAHRTLPFGTQLQVTNPANGESVVVTVNDRGPFHGNRVIDLSDAAAEDIGILGKGSGVVQLAVLSN